MRGGTFMSLLLKTLYEAAKKKYGLHLLCGQQGLSKELSWVYYTEDIHTMDYIHRGNLVITTGMVTATPDLFRQFTEEVMKQDTVGLIINVGHYIQENDLDADLLAFCEKEHYPLFTLPWKVHISDIMQDYLNLIVSSEKDETILIKAFLTAIHTPNQPERYEQEINISPFSPIKNYRIIFFAAHENSLSDEIKQRILLQGKNFMNESNIPYLFFSSFPNFILITCEERCLYAKETATTLQNFFAKSGFTCTAGIGATVSSIAALKRSYTQAMAAAAACRTGNTLLLSFDDLGIYQLFFLIEDTDCLSQYHDRLLLPLVAYDSCHHTALYTTLKWYLNCSGSLQKVALQCFTHRNTITYRMNQIRDLLRQDFSDAKIRMEYLTAYAIADYLKMLEKEN